MRGTVRDPHNEKKLAPLKKAFGSGDPKIQVRLGIGSPGGVMNWLPWQKHTIYKYGASLVGQAKETGWITTMKSRDALWSASRFNKITTRKGKVSDIVSQIAGENEMGTFIEPTSSPAWTFVQSRMSDVQFIQERMVPRAVNGSGRGG